MKRVKFSIFNSNNTNYEFLEIRFLQESLNSVGFIGCFSSLGCILFQRTKGETEWYGMRYSIETNRYKDLKEFNSLIKRIDEKVEWRSQPTDVIKSFNGDEYFLLNGDFFSVADKGKRCYYAVCNGETYARMVAKDEEEANKKIMELNEISKSTVFKYSLGEYFVID